MNNLGRITDKNGNLIEVGKLKNLSSEEKIPALSAVRVTVKTDSDTLHVPTPAADRIEIPVDKRAKWVGLVLGAVIGLVNILVAISQISSN